MIARSQAERLPADAGTVDLEPFSGPVDFAASIPGSKSLANRALLLAAVAGGTSRLASLPDSDDIRAAIGSLEALGVPVRREADRVEIDGCGLSFPNSSGVIPIGSSGTVGRFLPGLLAAAGAGDWTLAASPQLAGRPLGPLVEALRRFGARIDFGQEGKSFPLRVRGGGLAGGRTTVSAKNSSQFSSGVLMAAPLCRGRTETTVTDLDPEEAYIDITLGMMRRFAVESAVLDRSGPLLRVGIDAPQSYHAVTMAIEADFNSALYFLAAPLLFGGRAAIRNLSAGSAQPGRKFLAVLSRLGAAVSSTGEGVAVRAEKRPLRGGFAIDMRAMSEMALTLGVLAVFADAPITMTNLGHIRGHETDRLDALAGLLAEVGVRTENGPDWTTIHPADRKSLRAAAIDSRDDHRVVMSFALLGLAGNGLTIGNPGAVNKTFPEFFALLGSLGARMAFRPQRTVHR